jgi:hypothetical protein
MYLHTLNSPAFVVNASAPVRTIQIRADRGTAERTAPPASRRDCVASAAQKARAMAVSIAMALPRA